MGVDNVMWMPDVVVQFGWVMRAFDVGVCHTYVMWHAMWACDLASDVGV